MKTTLASALAAISLLGCSAEAAEEDPPPAHTPAVRSKFFGDQAFDLEEQRSIERAAAWVARKVGEEPPLIVWGAPHVRSWEPAPTMTIVRRGNDYGGHYAPNGGIDLGMRQFYFSGERQFIPEVVLEGLAAHEFGHHYGLGHARKGSLGAMREHNPIFRWTRDDVDACVASGRRRCAEAEAAVDFLAAPAEDDSAYCHLRSETSK
jgi:hypothetical protein